MSFVAACFLMLTVANLWLNVLSNTRLGRLLSCGAVICFAVALVIELRGDQK
jgi:hypothetical protein